LHSFFFTQSNFFPLNLTLLSIFDSDSSNSFLGRALMILMIVIGWLSRMPVLTFSTPALTNNSKLLWKTKKADKKNCHKLKELIYTLLSDVQLLISYPFQLNISKLSWFPQVLRSHFPFRSILYLDVWDNMTDRKISSYDLSVLSQKNVSAFRGNSRQMNFFLLTNEWIGSSGIYLRSIGS